VNWVDYASRMALGSPPVAAREAIQLAGRHAVWLVWAPGYRSIGSACSGLVAELSVLRGLPYTAVSREARTTESMSLDEFPARS
jgi:hypothetical protein